MSVWREHDGGSCPVHEKAEVRVRFRNGETSEPWTAGKWNWRDRAYDFDIAAYQVTSVEAVE